MDPFQCGIGHKPDGDSAAPVDEGNPRRVIVSEELQLHPRTLCTGTLCPIQTYQEKQKISQAEKEKSQV